MEANEKEIKLPATCSFDEIKKKVSNKNDFWLIGERKWSLELNQKIIDAEKDIEKLGEKAETGIFLTKDLSNLNDFKNCSRLIFFNDKEQYQFIAVDKKCVEFVYYHSELEYKKWLEEGKEKDNMMNLRNVEPKKSKSKDHFRFTYAQNLGTIHTLNKGDKIYAIVDEETGEWRLGYELPKQQ